MKDRILFIGGGSSIGFSIGLIVLFINEVFNGAVDGVLHAFGFCLVIAGAFGAISAAAINDYVE